MENYTHYGYSSMAGFLEDYKAHAQSIVVLCVDTEPDWNAENAISGYVPTRDYYMQCCFVLVNYYRLLPTDIQSLVCNAVDSIAQEAPFLDQWQSMGEYAKAIIQALP